MEKITVLIRTINRDTLINAISSALREFENVIVVADNTDLNLNELPAEPTYLKVGQKFDRFNNAGINMGAYACSTKYFCLLDDDDEFVVGAGEYMTDKVNSDPSVDIWVPGLQFNNGSILCMGRGDLSFGNVGSPTYKTQDLFEYPFNSVFWDNTDSGIDFQHVRHLAENGKKVDWYGRVLYNIRPRLQGTNGGGVK